MEETQSKVQGEFKASLSYTARHSFKTKQRTDTDELNEDKTRNNCL